jgi:inosine-uridine nucleoside N-ribohydrolase
MQRPLLLDVDTGVDDAVAIALASRLTNHRLVALTTVAGNVPIEDATENTLRVANWLGIDVPVYRGMSGPLVVPLLTAREHHGQGGLGSWSPPPSPRTVGDLTAPEAIVRLARDHRGEITFVFVGPLTNLAVALLLEPRLVDWVARLVIMGGAFFERGNVDEASEFNIHVDPDAAARVARAGFNVLWVGLDATRQTQLTPSRWEELRDASDPGEVLVREVMRRSFEELGRTGFPLHDPLAVALAEDPQIATVREGTVRVDVGRMTRGETRLALPAEHDRPAAVAHVVDTERFFRLFDRVCPRRE